MIADADLNALLAVVHERYGYDFTAYSPESLKRRINRLLLLDKFSSPQGMIFRLLTDAKYITRFVEELTVNVTEMFRDPHVYRVLREKVLPELAHQPFIKIWHAGCSTGEEVYSMAILLQEAGLLDRSILYATDLNSDVLETASRGIFALSTMKAHSENYLQSGGNQEFSTYYTAVYDKVIFHESLRRKMVFSTHNLVSDGSFNEFHLILCRNVLIYFEIGLQQKVLTLFDDSLAQGGFICLGSKETLKFSGLKPHYRQLEKEKIWLKKE